MRPSVFLSHTHDDKEFVRRLARDLDNQGIETWLDESEIKFGDSLIEKIRAGLDRVDFVAVVLTPKSVASEWVKREVDVAMTQEIQGKRVKVVPIMYKKCELPGFLLGKYYADFTEDSDYNKVFSRLVTHLGVVFNSTAHSPTTSNGDLNSATTKAVNAGLPLLRAPFHRPYQYIGMNVIQAANKVQHAPNSVGNIIIETAECHMLLEAEGNFISYVEIEIKGTIPHYQHLEFDSEVVLGTVSISPSELELVRRSVHCHTYYDHRKKLKIAVACHVDGGPLSIGFSSKYYGQ